MKQIEGGVTAAKGFEAASTAAGLHYEGREDMALIVSDKPCEIAGTFTTNVVQAAPVKWDRQLVENGTEVRAVVINSGIANACTGQEGIDICRATAKAAAKTLGLADERQVAVGSTGVIGIQLPLEKLTNGVRKMAGQLAATREAGTAAAKAIMTTDTKPKEAAVTFDVDGVTVTIGGMAKGSGMIHPNMCTMLSFVTTDAVIAHETLQTALGADILDTYNMVSVDGDTSTNDTVLLMANGLAGNPEILPDTAAFAEFKQALHTVNESLARQMAADGEGSTALFTVEVAGADSKDTAKTIARSVVSSSLVKTAVAGHDANWGRILCAMGYSGAEFDPEKVDLYLESDAGKIQILQDGLDTGYSEDAATEILSEPAITAVIDLNMGEGNATAWGCDLTHGYIDINAGYRS